MALDECSTFAIHDLAALAEGNLSVEGRQRLAGHISHCSTCMATLLAIVDDTPPSQGSGDHGLAAWVATVVAAASEGMKANGSGTDKASEP